MPFPSHSSGDWITDAKKVADAYIEYKVTMESSDTKKKDTPKLPESHDSHIVLFVLLAIAFLGCLVWFIWFFGVVHWGW